MASSVDAKMLKSTRFPLEFNQKVDMTKVNVEVMKKWIAGKISEILGNEDDVVIELCFNLLEGARYPDIKVLQIQLTGFLDKDTPKFCKELWLLCLSAQSNPQGVPKELLEAKKLELIQEKIEADKAAGEKQRRQEQDHQRERNIDSIRQRERGERGSVEGVVALGLAGTTMTTAAEVLAGHVPHHRGIEVHQYVMIFGKAHVGRSTHTSRTEVESVAYPGPKVRIRQPLSPCLLLDAVKEVVVVRPVQSDVTIPVYRLHALLMEDLEKAVLAEAENAVIVETDPTHPLKALAHHRLDHAVGGARLHYHLAAYRPSQQEPGLEIADGHGILSDLVRAH